MTTSLFTLLFWRATFERVVKTVAQTAGALLLANGTGLLDTDWATTVSVAGMAGLIALLTSVGSDVATGGTGPSLAGGEVLEEYIGRHELGRDERGATEAQTAMVAIAIGVLGAVAVMAVLVFITGAWPR